MFRRKKKEKKATTVEVTRNVFTFKYLKCKANFRIKYLLNGEKEEFIANDYELTIFKEANVEENMLRELQKAINCGKFIYNNSYYCIDKLLQIELLGYEVIDMEDSL